MSTIKTRILALIFTSLFFSTTTSAQDEGYIYGEVKMIDGKSYKGELRWGNEEAFWTDIFNSTKVGNPFIKQLDKDDMKDMKPSEKDNKDDWGFMRAWVDNRRYPSKTHSFACRFGDLKSMEITGRNAVKVELKNGDKIDLNGGSNDIGASIQVIEAEIGKIDLRWDKIEEINFDDTPKKLKKKIGENALYATVKTRKGEFKGFIQWDHDECIDTDKLDGTSNDGKMSIEFGNIKSIAKDGRGCNVTLNSGREVYLYGSNDVNSENRGIVVKDEDYGRVLVGWNEFESLTFSEPKNSGPAFSDFKAPKKIQGTVKTVDGNTFKGEIAYDLDEYLDFELLDGDDDGLEYKIPFSKIKSIKPKNFNYTTIKLRSGQELLLGDSQDVSDRNDGLLVFESKDNPEYIPWDKIEEITLD